VENTKSAEIAPEELPESPTGDVPGILLLSGGGVVGALDGCDCGGIGAIPAGSGFTLILVKSVARFDGGESLVVSITKRLKVRIVTNEFHVAHGAKTERPS
jgi:hypothetical protein